MNRPAMSVAVMALTMTIGSAAHAQAGGKITEGVAPLPPPPGLDEAGQAPPSTRRFPNGERVSLAFEPAGMGGTGTITHHAPGQPVKSVTIGYMSEFGAIMAANRVRYSVSGTTGRGERSWSCEVTID